MLTLDQLKLYLQYEPDTGKFYQKKSGKLAGCKHTGGYWQIHVNKKLYLAHRLAWFYVHGDFPDGQIDHLDGNRLNNAISNLRNVSGFLNQQNRKVATKQNKSGVLGAHFDKRTGRYNAHISINGKATHIGNYFTSEEAHAAYIKVKRLIHPGNTL